MGAAGPVLLPRDEVVLVHTWAGDFFIGGYRPGANAGESVFQVTAGGIRFGQPRGDRGDFPKISSLIRESHLRKYLGI